jgi:hypothetical protein
MRHLLLALCLAASNLATAEEPRFVGTLQGAADLLFPGSRPGAYGFVRQADGAVTYFRVNGLETHARRLDAAGRIVGSFVDADGRTRDFVIRAPVGVGYVELSLDPDDEDLVG